MWNKKSITVPPAGPALKPDTSSWAELGRTKSSTIYAVEPRIVALIPDSGTVGNGEVALANVEFLNTHFRTHGPGVVLTYVDGLVSQDGEARKIYRERTDRNVVLGGGMIAASLLGRAIGAFFLKMMVSEAPFRLFGSFDEALGWGRGILRAFDDDVL